MEADKQTELKDQTRRSSGKRLLVKAFKLVLAVIVIYFAGRQMISNWSEVSQYQWSINPLLIFISVVLHLITFALFSKVWCLLIKAFGYDVPLRHGFKIAYITNLGRYIPGKIWPVIGMIYLLKQININKETAFASWGIATLLGLPPAFLAGAVTVYFFPEMLTDSITRGSVIVPVVAIVLTLGASLFLVFLPKRTMGLFNWIVKLFRRPPVQFKLDKKVALQVYLGYFICWICYGVAFYTFVHGIMAEPNIPAIAGIGSFVMAYLIGYLAVFSPGGLGTREWVLTTVLAPFLGPLASGVAVAARVWNLAVEFIAFAIALLIKMEKK